MPGSTPILGIPYPVGGDPLGDGASQIQALAEYIEDTLWTPWTSYTPTITNLTLGTGGEKHAKYRRLFDQVDFKIAVLLGTGGDVTGNLIVDYSPTGLDPVGEDGMSINVQNHIVGYCHATDDAPQNYVGVMYADGSLWFDRTTSDSADADSPFDWEEGDSLYIRGSYQVAIP